ncbi:MAG TPA: branched-chain amino acid ABC transporter permease [Acidimicrobiales bacterium]|nr:branched-chain amino acid ABC transporter permease [Acidimicrobiales bacterium]
MAHFVQQVLDGLASGAIYASLALALVLIFRSTHIVNFAQGEMAMFATFIAWQLFTWGVPVWAAIAATLVVAFLGGMAVERMVIRPVEGSSELTIVIVTLGLLLVFNQGAGWIWDFIIKQFPNPFPAHVFDVGGVRTTAHTAGVVAVLLLIVLGLWALFQHTKIGLAMRAAAENPESSRLVGIRVGRMMMLGWGLAAALGALAGCLVAPRLFLEPNMMFSVTIYAFAAATLGGFDSPGGAVLGGLIVGVTENLAGTYIPFIHQDLKILVPLLVIVAVLLVRPNGLFGHREVVRV